MKIGELSIATGTNIEAFRYYERIGQLPTPDRTAANYRGHGEPHVVRHSRVLGCTMEEICSPLGLSDHPDRDGMETDRIATSDLVKVEARIAQLQALRDELARIVGRRQRGVEQIAALGNHNECRSRH